MWKKILLTSLAVNLTGCSTVLEVAANHYDSRDPCQTTEFSRTGQRLKPQNYELPWYCGGAGDRTYIYNAQGQKIGYTKK
jgi:hypothetical protein